jgi:hypothetical protein
VVNTIGNHANFSFLPLFVVLSVLSRVVQNVHIFSKDVSRVLSAVRWDVTMANMRIQLLSKYLQKYLVIGRGV